MRVARPTLDDRLFDVPGEGTATTSATTAPRNANLKVGVIRKSYKSSTPSTDVIAAEHEPSVL
ncbi:MAG: hypothetical protein AABZ02_06035 [Bacteroidota bacterium]